MSPARELFSAMLLPAIGCLFWATIGSASESRSPAQDDAGPALKIEMNLDSLKKLLLEGGKILENPEGFVRTDEAYKIAAAYYAKGKIRIVSEEWKNALKSLGGKISDAAGAGPFLKLLARLETELPDFAARAGPVLAGYLPRRDYCRIDSKVYFTALTAFDSMNIWDSVVINALNPKYGLDADFLLNTLVHELYHSGYGSCSPFREEPMIEQKLYYVLESLHNEGLATYVAHQASRLYPAAKNADYSLAANEDHVVRLRGELNDFLSKISTVPGDQALRDAFDLGVRRRAFYVVGFDMARVIERKMGRERLVETMARGPISFYELYNSAAGEDGRLLPIDFNAHLSRVDALKRALESGDAGRVREAGEIFLKERDEIPQSELESFYRLGYRLLRGRKQYDRAETVFELIIRLAENPSFAYAYLGEIEINRGRTERARELLSKSLDLDPSNPLAGQLRSRLDKEGPARRP